MMRFRTLAAVGLLISLAALASAQKRSFIDWKNLHNPVLSYPQWSVKDPAMVYRNGRFFVFFSAFYKDKGQIRSHVVEIRTKDFKHFSEPIFNFDGDEDGWIGMCSPDVQYSNGRYVMTFNSWGEQPGKPDQLFYETSTDLVHWSHRKPLALNLTEIGGQQSIDAALAAADGGYYLAYKEIGEVVMRTHIAFSTRLDGPFAYVGDGIPSVLMTDGKDNGLTHENYEFIRIDRQWYLLTTDYTDDEPVVPPMPHLYTLDSNSHWLKWTRGYRFDIPHEQFNTDHIANATALYDLRKYDSYFYVIYAGRTGGQSYAGRGWNQLGLARSKDLIHWSTPGLE